MLVYEFLYNSNCHESSYRTMSIHKTRKGAEMAMEFHKAETKKYYIKEYGGVLSDVWYYNEDWTVIESELLE